MMQEGSKYKCLMKGDVLKKDAGSFTVYDLVSLGVSVRIYSMAIADLIEFEKKHNNQETNKVDFRSSTAIVDLLKSTVKDSAGNKLLDGEQGAEILAMIPAKDAQMMFNEAARLTWGAAEEPQKK